MADLSWGTLACISFDKLGNSLAAFSGCEDVAGESKKWEALRGIRRFARCAPAESHQPTLNGEIGPVL